MILFYEIKNTDLRIFFELIFDGKIKIEKASFNWIKIFDSN